MKTIKNYIETSLNESLLDDDDIFYDHENDKKVIEEWIKNNYRFSDKLTISDDFVVDCNGNVGVYVKSRNIESLTNGMFRWGKVEGNFTCSFASITSLEGAPEEVGKNFDCSDCAKLKSLEGTPEKIGGDFNCGNCRNLESLEGAPESVRGSFICSDCVNLESLEGAPKEVGVGFYCSQCNSLTTLKGSPKKVGGYFNCRKCINLKSLEGAPEKIGARLNCRYCDNLKITDSDRKKYKIND